MTRVVHAEGRRRNVVASAPDLHLRLAVLLDGLCFVQALQRAVVTLVEPPRPFDRQPHAVHPIHDDPQRADRALQHRREAEIDVQLFGEQLPGGVRRLAPALFRKVHIVPAGEEVLDVPDALPMANENKFTGHAKPPWIAVSRRAFYSTGALRAARCIQFEATQSPSLRTVSTPTDRVAKSAAPAVRISASV